jgi:pilus retraction protein PilT
MTAHSEIFDELLKLAVESGVSDVVVKSNKPGFVRIAGRLKQVDMDPILGTEAQAWVDEHVPRVFRPKWDDEGQVDFAYTSEDIGRFRVNAFHQRGTVSIVFRHIKSRVPEFEELGLNGESLLKLAQAKDGILLVCGATGSGKSSTMAAMLNWINRNLDRHIVTIEDPIEFVYRHKKSIVSQREVGFDTLSFHAALRNTLRQAPDVILIGEVRDQLTMEAAITFAETGHLCLATLHSNNANQAIERILNFFPHERHEQIHLQLSLNLRAILSQRLIPGLAGTRVAAIEVLMDTPRVKDLIKKAEIDTLKEAMEQGLQEGCQTFDLALLRLYLDGKIDLDQALANADSANNLRLRIRNEELKHGKSESKEGPTFRIEGREPSRMPPPLKRP